ncbi:hypothetical protein AAFA10_25310, partial [Klebsiella pneumoniae]
ERPDYVVFANELAAAWLPRVRVFPWLTARHREAGPVRKSRTPGSVRGVSGNGYPYRDISEKT